MNAAARPIDSRQLFRYVLRLGDLSLVLAQRLGEWVGHAPALEEDLGLANVALDLIGQARLLLTYAGEIEGRGRGEDELAFLREHGEYLNATLVELPNGDFGRTIVRQVLVDAFQLELYERMSASSDERLAEIAAKAVKEIRYHLRYSGGWLVRLGDGTDESHARVQSALDSLWPYTVELFAEDELDRSMAEHGIAPRLSEVQAAWSTRIDPILAEATLTRPADRPHAWHGKRGQHSEHLGYMLAEMQYLQRAHPGARW
ncbi:MAG TPA: 1,2-phenylacetyl-CoA epoxidase subunit PaaC [Steroidobacteraceae bacterium]|jgi:ring-1,2-phenylacetyl-CoA epoxidase subunit PaaC|nr:1,2-phenylacetyl-CoA epoxidase subunit PaaC [Steroidobacteraceae bacterium]